MPKYALKDVYISNYDVSGSTDSFQFNPQTLSRTVQPHEPPEEAKSEPPPVALTLCYEPIRQTYDEEGLGYTASDDLFL